MKQGMNSEMGGFGPGGITFATATTTCGDARAYEPVCRRRTVPTGLGKPLDLAGGHLLSHVKQEPTVAFFNATHQPAELVQKTSLFPGTAPNDIVSALALRKVGEFGGSSPS